MRTLTAQPISLCAATCEHLAQLELADSCSDDSTLEVDVLIGSDYYWDLATGEVRRGESGPVPINTRLGWVLSGPATPNRQESTHKLTMSLLAAHTPRVDAEPSNTHTFEEFSEKIHLVEG